MLPRIRKVDILLRLHYAQEASRIAYSGDFVGRKGVILEHPRKTMLLFRLLYAQILSLPVVHL